MSWTVLCSQDFRVVPWKNGRGTTTELLRIGQDRFAWRLSVAPVAEDAQFSDFSGYQRTLAILDGAGIVLTIAQDGSKDDVKLTQGDVVEFSGDAKTFGKLIKGPIRDFNAIVDREQGLSAQCRVVNLSNDVPYSIGIPDRCSEMCVYVVSGSLTLKQEVFSKEAQSEQLLWLSQPTCFEQVTLCAAAGATAVVVQIQIQASNKIIPEVDWRSSRPEWLGLDDRSFFSMGLSTLKVPMSLHANNRNRLLQQFRSLKIGDDGQGVVLMQGGLQQTRNDTDHELLFRQESYFHWLVGTAEPGQFAVLDLDHVSGTAFTTLFVPRIPAEDAAWLGTIWPPSYFKAKYEVDDCKFVDELPAWMVGRSKECQEGPLPVCVLYGRNTDSGNFAKPAFFDGLEDFKVFAVDRETLFPVIANLRVHKTPEELRLMRYVAKVSSEAHVEVMRATRPGMAEYQLESMFQHHVYSKAGCRNLAYTCICACGPNSATLHYGHAGAPNNRILQGSDMAMLDMGAEYHCYCADISCCFPVSGRFSSDQRLIWEIELEAVKAVMDHIRPGVSWADLHRRANRAVLEGLKRIGVLNGDVGEMERKNVGAIFFPCGMGHFIGCDTHDVGGYLEGCPERVNLPGIKKLRTARVLETGMCLTVEPGIYFVQSSIDRALCDNELRKFLVPEVLVRFRGSGGMRMEDVITITKSGFENLTCCPRSVEEIEAVMAGGPWPPIEDKMSWLHRC